MLVVMLCSFVGVKTLPFNSIGVDLWLRRENLSGIRFEELDLHRYLFQSVRWEPTNEVLHAKRNYIKVRSCFENYYFLLLLKLKSLSLITL